MWYFGGDEEFAEEAVYGEEVVDVEEEAAQPNPTPPKPQAPQEGRRVN